MLLFHIFPQYTTGYSAHDIHLVVKKYYILSTSFFNGRSSFLFLSVHKSYYTKLLVTMYIHRKKTKNASPLNDVIFLLPWECVTGGDLGVCVGRCLLVPEFSLVRPNRKINTLFLRKAFFWCICFAVTLGRRYEREFGN